MSLRETLKASAQTFSFEIFPPKTSEALPQLRKTLEELKSLHPSFISVTMGAMGTNKGTTFEVVETIESDFKISGVAHLTCVSSMQEEILQSLKILQKTNIKNLLCLRGDPPQGASRFTPPAGGFQYASELVAFIRKNTGDYFTIGVAGYPEGHLECQDKEKDLAHLKIKADAGADFILTQLFFDNHDYFDFVARARKIGITQKIIPGIMPITNFSQLQKFTQLCGAKIPDYIRISLEKIKDQPEQVRSFGVEYAIKQSLDLLDQKAPGLHFYILNQTDSIKKIYQGLGKTF